MEHIKSVHQNKLSANLHIDNYNDYYKYHKVIIKNESFINIIKTHSVRKHLILAAVINYSIVLAHYGSVFFVNYLNTERHINYFIGCCAEIVGMLLLYFIIKRIGTKLTLMLYLFVLAFLWGGIGLSFKYLTDGDGDSVKSKLIWL